MLNVNNVQNTWFPKAVNYNFWSPFQCLPSWNNPDCTWILDHWEADIHLSFIDRSCLEFPLNFNSIPLSNLLLHVIFHKLVNRKINVLAAACQCNNCTGIILFCCSIATTSSVKYSDSRAYYAGIIVGWNNKDFCWHNYRIIRRPQSGIKGCGSISLFLKLYWTNKKILLMLFPNKNTLKNWYTWIKTHLDIL